MTTSFQPLIISKSKDSYMYIQTHTHTHRACGTRFHDKTKSTLKNQLHWTFSMFVYTTRKRTIGKEKQRACPDMAAIVEVGSGSFFTIKSTVMSFSIELGKKLCPSTLPNMNYDYTNNDYSTVKKPSKSNVKEEYSLGRKAKEKVFLSLNSLLYG